MNTYLVKYETSTSRGIMQVSATGVVSAACSALASRPEANITNVQPLEIYQPRR